MTCQECGTHAPTFNNQGRDGYVLDYGPHTGEQMPRWKKLCSTCIATRYPETTLAGGFPNGRLWRSNDVSER